ncbi:MAG: hypothetical protein Q7T33_10380 [Dehalococcoidia bacterium]|nr:hypothetical protein [Dehalococcoidia bacterium]
MKTMRVMLMGALVVATGVLAACNGDEGSDGTPTSSPAPSAVETAEPSATPSLEDEVGAAYLEYWDAYSAALLELDASLAEEFAVGGELDRIKGEIESLAVQGLALRVRVEHNFAVVEASDSAASVIDEIVNNSFLVDAETKEPPEAEGSGERFQDTFDMEKVDGRWVVVKTTRIRVEG